MNRSRVGPGNANESSIAVGRVGSWDPAALPITGFYMSGGKKATVTSETTQECRDLEIAEISLVF